MTSLPAYALGLLAIVLLTGLTGWKHLESRGQLWRVGAALALNWGAGLLYVSNTGNYTPWQFSIFIDSAAALTILFHPAGRAQAYIGLFYLFQIAGHIAYGGRHLLGYPADPVYYYDAITWVAWAQLLAVGVWSIGLWCGDILHRIRDRGHALDRRKVVRVGGAK